MFNQRDLNDAFLLHKELGFGPRFVDTNLRVSYPTLPSLLSKRRMKLELLAEEMRVLYVALTRAREKLYLLGTVKSLDKLLRGWGRHLSRKIGICRILNWRKRGAIWIGSDLHCFVIQMRLFGESGSALVRQPLAYVCCKILRSGS